MADDRTPVHDPSALDPRADLVSKRRARKWAWALVAVVFLGTITVLYESRRSTTADIEAPKAFCRAADAYEKELARQAERYEIDTPRQIARVEDLVATAPKAIRADAETFLASLRAIDAAPTKAQKRALQDDPQVKRAVENVNRYWNQGCGVYDRQGGI